MTKLMEEMPERIAQLEKNHGSDNPFVIMLKDQYGAMKETNGQNTEQIYLTSAMKR